MEISKESTFTVVLEPETDPDFPGYYNVHVPALPGCLTYGVTRDRALANAKKAILGYLETLEKEGLPIPEADLASVEKVTIPPVGADPRVRPGELPHRGWEAVGANLVRKISNDGW